MFMPTSHMPFIKMNCPLSVLSSCVKPGSGLVASPRPWYNYLTAFYGCFQGANIYFIWSVVKVQGLIERPGVVAMTVIINNNQ